MNPNRTHDPAGRSAIVFDDHGRAERLCRALAGMLRQIVGGHVEVEFCGAGASDLFTAAGPSDLNRRHVLFSLLPR